MAWVNRLIRLVPTLTVPLPVAGSRMASTSVNRHRPFTIAVEGNLGSGKTTFLEHFQQKHSADVETVAEPVDLWRKVGPQGHNLFELMYSDPAKWGFTFQTLVQLTMTRLHQMTTNKPVKMMERSIFSARYIFVENLFKEKIISPEQEVVLNEWFTWLTDKPSVSCDLIVYLRVDPSVAYQRMKDRGRPEEKCVPMDYIQRIHTYHEDWLVHKTAFSLPCPVLVLNANQGLDAMLREYRTCEEVLSTHVIGMVG